LTISCEKTIFNVAPVIGKPGFRILSEPFAPTHNHPPPYAPLDLALENARRATLSPNDPSLHTPPSLAPTSRLAAFLNSIHPSLGSPANMAALELHGISRDEDLDDLFHIGDGVYELFSEVPGLDPLVPALIAEGVRVATVRMQQGETERDGAFVRGVEKERTLSFVQRMIETGSMA
jgi:hypothetical protein